MGRPWQPRTQTQSPIGAPAPGCRATGQASAADGCARGRRRVAGRAQPVGVFERRGLLLLALGDRTVLSAADFATASATDCATDDGTVRSNAAQDAHPVLGVRWMEAMEPNAWRVGWLMFWMAVRWWISHDFWHRESTTTTSRVGQRGRDTQQRTHTDATDATNAMTQSKSDRGGREGEGDRGNGAGRREPIGPGRGRFSLLTFEERSAIGLTRK